MRTNFILFTIIALIFFSPINGAEKSTATYNRGEANGLARFGQPKLAKTFKHLPYVNPNAPKGGTLRLSMVGYFDSLNPFNIKGTTVYGHTITFDSLMVRNLEEPFTIYCLIAESVSLAPDNSQITFYLHQNVKFHDDSPLTAEDVKFTVELLLQHGTPAHKNVYSKIEKIIITDNHTITFYFKKNEQNEYDPELPLIIGLIKPLSKKQLENVDFSSITMSVLQGTGPYQIITSEIGRQVVYQRNPNYWGKDLAINCGRFNYDKIIVNYFKNWNSTFAAFTAGDADIFFDDYPTHWATGYDIKQIHDKSIIKQCIKLERPVLVRNLIFNMHRPIFQSPKVREAIALAFDFDKMNNTIGYNQMFRPYSLFANTFLSHKGAANGKELEILEKFSSQIPSELFAKIITKDYQSNFTNPHRQNLIKADQLLNEAGWAVNIENGLRFNDKGEQLKFSIMFKDPAMEKILIPFCETLKKLGIILSLLKFDNVQYENLVQERNFDIIPHTFANSLSPGVEQAYYFGAKFAEVKGSSNYMGIKDHVAEALAKNILNYNKLEDFTAAVRAFDRYVTANNWIVPISYDPYLRFAYWQENIDFPNIDPKVGLQIIEHGWSKKIN